MPLAALDARTHPDALPRWRRRGPLARVRVWRVAGADGGDAAATLTGRRRLRWKSGKLRQVAEAI